MRWFLFSIAMLTTVTAWASAVPDTSRHETAGRVDTVYIVRTDVTADSVARVAPYVRRLNNYYRMWARLIPHGARIQYAGNMGMFSGGPTWIYGRRHWETSLMFGFVPKHNAHHAVMTMTLKQDYIPWTVHVAGELVDFQPLATLPSATSSGCTSHRATPRATTGLPRECAPMCTWASALGSTSLSASDGLAAA